MSATNSFAVSTILGSILWARPQPLQRAGLSSAVPPGQGDANAEEFATTPSRSLLMTTLQVSAALPKLSLSKIVITASKVFA